MALICAVSIAVPSFASGAADEAIPEGGVSENRVVTICDAYSQQLGVLDSKGGGIYSGIISGLDSHGKFSVRVRVDDVVYGSAYMGKWQNYTDDTWKEAIKLHIPQRWPTVSNSSPAHSLMSKRDSQ